MEKGDAEKVKFHEARLALLREMRGAAPAEVRLGLAGGLAAAGPRHAAIEDRVAKLEKKVDEILARLGGPADGGGQGGGG
jgi:hypothetical protein